MKGDDSLIAYYYCGFDTFRSMLNSKSIWLTNLRKSNDSQEVTRLYNQIWEDVKKMLVNSDLDAEIVKFNIEQFEYAKDPQIYFDVPYGCCLSLEDDLVQQWNEYGDKGKGVSVGFDLDWFGIKNQLPITSANISEAIGYDAVRYDSQKLRNGFSKLFYDAIKQEGRTAWIYTILPTIKHYAGFIKNPSFRDEKEIRILFYPSDDFECSFPGLSEYCNEVKPHYCLNWANNSSTALRSVTVGYACEHTLEEIKAVLEGCGLISQETIFLRKSDCSYRDRITESDIT